MNSAPTLDLTSQRLTTTLFAPAYWKARAKLATPSPSITFPWPVTQADKTTIWAWSFRPYTLLTVRKPSSGFSFSTCPNRIKASLFPCTLSGYSAWVSNYAPLGAGYRFIDLVGRAYRRAGAQLLGLPGAALSPPYLALCAEDRRNLEGLAAALKNGGGPGATAPAVAAAIKPLQVYREEMKRQ